MAMSDRLFTSTLLLHRLGEIAIPEIHQAISPISREYGHKQLDLNRGQGSSPDQPAQHSFGRQAQDDIDAFPEQVILPGANLLVL